MAHSAGVKGMMSDYTHLRTLPALLSVLFVLAGLYQFGGISEVHITWLDYTLTTQHATLTSVGVFLLAFASSETKSFDHYEQSEQIAIAAGPLLILGYQYSDTVYDIVSTESMWGPVIAFLVTVISWAVAVR